MLNPTASFIYTAAPARVVFGSGTLEQVAQEAAALGMLRPLVLSTPQQADLAERVAGLLGSACAGVFSGAVMHTPVAVTMAALDHYVRAGGDGMIAVGGGSTIGLAKAMALRNDAPQLVSPTTYAGSEMTSIVGQTEDGVKTTQTTPVVRPETVIYDVDLTLSLPPLLSITSGLNAIAHAVEALYARNGNPVLDLMAAEGIAAMVRALPGITQKPDDPAARSQALYGAWLCGLCLASGGVALHHKLCHVLGGRFDLPHAETHAIVLPHALAYNAPAVSDAMQRLRDATRADDPVMVLADIGARAGVPAGLRALGMPEAGIDEAVALALHNPYWNPRPISAAGILHIIRAAWAGDAPTAFSE